MAISPTSPWRGKPARPRIYTGSVTAPSARTTTGATAGTGLSGWYELRRVADDDSVEIAYFGIVGEAIGRGFGKHLLSCAVRDAWALRPRRVWLHTCTLDHPHALPNYLARGFTKYKTETYEVA